ncbi:ABC transporter substrate-binding protein [Paraburkholderia sp. UYCP14C]|uniref:ABC transporter substrate-binding protein n=1 Tax=Paraburkholderia sp. UYCP14C TaxID=2511130 RepID=UPI001459FD1C|nr:ABC transporter substrate-binding protein [Paraburkholderia sp. UYCP14C]
MKLKAFFCAVLTASALLSSGASFAADTELLPPSLLAPGSTEMVPAGKFKKAGPWVIGFSWPGVGNTWIVQAIKEAQFAASKDPNIKDLRIVEANWQPAKQVADIEDLMARKVDALVILPINPELVKAQIAEARAKGIPVIVYSARGTTVDSTVLFSAGGEYFGRVGGEFLKDQLKGKGTVWAFRGVAGSSDDTARYNGFRKAIDGTGIKIGAEVYGEWNYVKSKQLCENLLESGRPVDGIWFSGAEMTRACVDVFKELGKPLVPMTGEGNNGYLRIWKAHGLKSVGAVFTPGLGVGMVRAATALLSGQSLYTVYDSDPKPITTTNLDQYYRPDLNDAFWVPSTLPADVIKTTFKR